MRERVGLFDQTSFVKFAVTGPDAATALNRLSAAEVDTAPGTAVYTQWCNDRGGIEADLTVTRLEAESFLVVTSAATQTRDWARLRRGCRDFDVTISDITEQQAMLGLWARWRADVLGPLTGASLADEDFPFSTARTIDVAGRGVLAIRMSYVGELGWELYVPNADAGDVFDALTAAGEPHGLALAGYHAMNTLRLESGYRHWGHDISPADNPLEAGLGFAVGWDKAADFNGRAALEAQRGRPRTKRLVQFRLEHPELLVYHDEHDPARRCGGGMHTVGSLELPRGRFLAMGYLDHAEGVTADWLASGSFEIDVGGRRVPATASLRSFYTPRRR